MKLSYIVLTFLLVSSFVLVGNKGITEEKESDLKQLMNAFEKEDITMKDWRLYAREQREQVEDFASFKREGKQIAQKFPDFKWTFNRQEKVWKAVGEKQGKGKISEKITFSVHPQKHRNYTYLIYEMSGSGIQEPDWEVITVNIEEKQRKLFHKTPTFYACLEGQVGDMMEGVLYSQAKRILEHLSAQPIERVEEEGFISISAYSNKLTEEVLVGNQKMNVQLGLREQGMGDAISITIGTPIITIEY